MTSFTISNLDDEVWRGLRERASQHGRSIEEEVRVILCEAVGWGNDCPPDLVEFTRESFAPFGGVDLKSPSRGPMCEPPDFS